MAGAVAARWAQRATYTPANRQLARARGGKFIRVDIFPPPQPPRVRSLCETLITMDAQSTADAARIGMNAALYSITLSSAVAALPPGAAEIATTGCVVLPGFLTREATAAMAASCRSGHCMGDRQRAHRVATAPRPWLLGDPRPQPAYAHACRVGAF